ncbi:MAG TPA: GNAT family N-acetyltransferase [Gammaproteobacteria bacterium]|nr:GNAT family N-acetyltransferase [Gammaproteobacteria bacterium]
MLALAELDARISTARLELTPLRRDHAEEMFSILSDVSLYEHTRGVPPASVSELHARYTYLESRRSPDGTEAWLNWVLVEIATGMSIGYVQVTVTSQHADIAWVVGTLWQRRGFATEAANAVVAWLRCAGVRAVRARIHPMHSASQRVAANAELSLTHETIAGECVWVRRI